MDPLLFFERFPEIRYKIVDALSTRDLLNCKQVNHSWRQISAHELSTRNSYAHVTKKCRNIRWLCRQLKHADNCTIDTIKINIPEEHSGDCLEIYNEEDAKRQCKNLKKLRLRHLDLRLWTCSTTEKLIREIVLGASCSLEELTLDYGPGSDGDLGLRGSKTEFPKLKIINIGPRYGSSWDDAFHLMRLAPNLQAVNGLLHLSDINIEKCSRLYVITTIDIVSYERMGEIFKLFVRAEPKLVELLISDASERLIPVRWSKPLLQLFQRCAFTLKRLSICAIKFYHLQRKENFVLGALDFLELNFPLKSTVQEFAKIIASLNLQDSCPALTSVRILFEEEYCICIHDMPSRLVAGDQPMCAPVPSVQEITFTEAVCTVGIMEACIVAFPNLASFGYENLRCTEICVDQGDEHFYGVYKIWTEIATLVKLKICMSDPDRAPKGVCMDALFCGISTGEVIRIKRICAREEVDLKKRQYCPLRPSLLYAKNLKQVTLVFAPDYDYYRMFCISEVTECLVLARNPSIRLCIESHCPDISDELKSVAQFAEIITITEGGDWW